MFFCFDTMAFTSTNSKRPSLPVSALISSRVASITMLMKFKPLSRNGRPWRDRIPSLYCDRVSFTDLTADLSLITIVIVPILFSIRG